MIAAPKKTGRPAGTARAWSGRQGAIGFRLKMVARADAADTLTGMAWERDWEARHAGERVGGLAWLDMPGAGPIEKKLNWFLFRRGLLEEGDLLLAGATPAERQHWRNRRAIARSRAKNRAAIWDF